MRPLLYLMFSIILLSSYSCKEPCEDIDCLYSGVCDDGICDCQEGYRGEFCENKILLLKEVYEDGELVLSYEYNSDRSLSKILWHSSNDSEPYRALIYNYYQDSLILNYHKVENEIVQDEVFGSEKFFQLGGDSIKVQIFQGGFMSSNSTITSFDSHCGQKRIEYNGSFRSYEYTDDNCSSIMEFRSLIDNSLISTITSTLDDKHAFDESIQIGFLRKENHGNELKSFITNAEGDFREILKQYEYNTFDYPISCIETDMDSIGNESMTNYTYEYY